MGFYLYAIALSENCGPFHIAAFAFKASAAQIYLLEAVSLELLHFAWKNFSLRRQPSTISNKGAELYVPLGI